MVVHLEVGHRLRNLVDTSVHSFKILALRILIVVFYQRLVMAIVLKDHLLRYLILVSISLIRDLSDGVFIDVVVIVMVLLLLD